MAEFEQAVVKYDDRCNLCRTAVAFAQKHGRDGQFLFEPLDSSDSETIQLVDLSGQHNRSTAILNIAAELKPPWSLLRHLRLVPLAWRDGLYNFVARHRVSWFGRHH